MSDFTVRGLTLFNVGLNIKRTCTMLIESHSLLPVPSARTTARESILRASEPVPSLFVLFLHSRCDSSLCTSVEKGLAAI